MTKGNSAAQLVSRRAALKRAVELNDAENLATIVAPDGGLLSWESSPHVLWLDCILRHFCWIPPEISA